MIQKYVDDIFVVKDDDIAATILLMMERAKMISEGAGAIGLAAMLHGNIPHADKTAAVISGGNIDVNMISRIIENGLVKSGRRIKLLTHLTDRPGECVVLFRISKSIKLISFMFIMSMLDVTCLLVRHR